MRNTAKSSLPVAALSRRRKLAAAVGAVMEPMERRQLMSAVVLSNGVLTVTGTAGADAIGVNYGVNPAGTDISVNVSLNGTVYDFTGQTVTGVVVNAGDGNDGVTINMEDGGPGVTVNGGAGNDTIGSSIVDNGNIVFNGGDGNDSCLGFDGMDLMHVTMNGGAGDDECVGGYDVQTSFDGGDGNDTDVIQYLTDPNVFLGGAGTDTLIVQPDDASAMTINLDGQSDSRLYNATSTFGNDIENVTVSNGQGNNVAVNGDALDNVISVQSGGGAVSINGGGGNDRLSAPGATAATLNGGDGNDTLVGGVGGTTFVGGAGTDVADYSAAAAAVTVHLDGSAVSGTATQVASGQGDLFVGDVEQVYGSAYNDALYGTAGNNALYGNGGNDTIYTMGGTDAAFGGDGNDTVYAADGGATYIDGGSGTDTAYVDPTGDTTANVEAVVGAAAQVQLSGTTFGNAGSYGNSANNNGQATDGNLSTYYDASQASGAYVAIDLGYARAVSQIKYAPRAGYAARMVGGTFQASNNVDFANAVTVGTVTAAPAANTLTVATPSTTTAYRYWRYVGPADGYCNVAEFQLFGTAAVAGTVTQAADGTVVVTGTSAADRIDVALAENDSGDDQTLTATLNGISYPFTYGPSGPTPAIVINAGDGNDIVTVEGREFSTVAIDGGNGDDSVSLLADDVSATIHGGAGNDTLSAAQDDPAAADPDVENVSLYGDAGDDSITLGQNIDLDSGDLLDGGDGNDTFHVTAGSNGTYQPITVAGGAGTDTLVVGGTGVSAVHLDGQQDTDLANPFASEPAHLATIGADVENASIPAGTLSGNASDNVLTDNGAGEVDGLAGNDTIYAKNGAANTIDGGPGTDTAYVDPTGDTTVNVESVVGAATPTATRLTGTTYGTPGSYKSDGNTIANATDGNLSTYFDAPAASGSAVGINLGSAQVVTQIKYAPRAGLETRMVGGAFQASSDVNFASNVVTVYTVTATPASGVLTTVNVSAGSGFQYWRYVGPANGYGNIAEFQLFGTGTTTPTSTRLSGTTYGTPGSYGNGGNTIARATDGNLGTFFDAPAASGSAVGIDLGTARTVTQLSFAPRSGYASRMVGGMFQASNDVNFASGVVTVYTVKTAPASGSLTTAAVSAGSAYRYWRYVGPANGYGNIAEFQLFGF